MFPFIKPHCKFFSSYSPPPILIKHLGMCLALLLINAQRVILFLPNLISLLLVNNIVIYQPGNFKKWVNLTYDSDTCSEVLDVVGLGWEVESEMNSQTLKFSLSEIVELGGGCYHPVVCGAAFLPPRSWAVTEWPHAQDCWKSSSLYLSFQPLLQIACLSTNPSVTVWKDRILGRPDWKFLKVRFFILLLVHPQCPASKKQ